MNSHLHEKTRLRQLARAILPLVRDVFFLCLLLLLTACNKPSNSISRQTKVVIASSQDGRVEDVSFYSPSLRRSMQYRVVVPSSYFAQPWTQSRVLYLLHESGGSYIDWQTKSHIARNANIANYILVMPEGGDSYYMNAAWKAHSRYEDYITRDLVADVDRHYRVVPGRRGRAIAGVSMGGFGAVTLALRHPELYFFAGAIGAPLDMAKRKFDFRDIGQYFAMERIFGLSGSGSRKNEDPFLLIHAVKPESKEIPFLFVACGAQDPLLGVNQLFARQLDGTEIPHAFFGEIPGGHDWEYWDDLSSNMVGVVAYVSTTGAKHL